MKENAHLYTNLQQDVQTKSDLHLNKNTKHIYSFSPYGTVNQSNIGINIFASKNT